MDIYYSSTRGGESHVTASQAILKGLADDGGLFMPDRIPKLECTLSELSTMSYQETAYQVMKLFFTDFTETELRDCINRAYDSKFDTEEIAPLVKADGAYYLELFHGSTIAFKDMALSILPHLMTTAARKNKVDDTIVILTATSGDTGKAAMAGFSDVEGTKIIVFYPKGGVSRIQELQMVTQRGSNTSVAAITGNFDDAQTGVKKIFGDKELAAELAGRGYRLSSANSINIGRLIPQIVYYVYAYGKLLEHGEIKEGEKISITVPTGNFGNILAAYFAKQMGLPVKNLICASNDNKVLYDFFQTGIYDRRREFILTTSPSMDILISSNLERLLYLASGCDAEETGRLMRDLSGKGFYEITPSMRENMIDFIGGFADQRANADEIRKVYRDTGYLIDTHTGVASAVARAHRQKTGDETKMLIASTASPYKFSRSVMEAICQNQEEISALPKDEFELIDQMTQVSGISVPMAVQEIRNAPIRHNLQCAPEKMEDMVKEILK